MTGKETLGRNRPQCEVGHLCHEASANHGSDTRLQLDKDPSKHAAWEETHTLTHTTLSLTHSHTHYTHTTHTLTHTTLAHTTLAHTTLAHTTLAHTTLAHTTLAHSTLSHTTLSHTTRSHHTLTHTLSHTLTHSHTHTLTHDLTHTLSLLRTNSSQLSARQMACQCCSMTSSCFPAVLVFFFAFFFSFATLVLLGPSPVSIAVCIRLALKCVRLLVFVLFECLVYRFFVCSLVEGPLYVLLDIGFSSYGYVEVFQGCMWAPRRYG